MTAPIIHRLGPSAALGAKRRGACPGRASATRGGAASRVALVGWVQLEGRYTIRWQRGDPVAYVLGAQQIDGHRMAGVVNTIPVSPSGWTDLAEIRHVGQRWRGQHRNQQTA